MKPVYFLLGALAFAPCYTPVANAQAPVAAETAQRERDATAAALVRLIGEAIAPDTSGGSNNNGDFKVKPKPKPSEWRVSYRPSSNPNLPDLIFVERDETVEMQSSFSLPNARARDFTTHPTRPNLKLSVEPYLSPAEYARLKINNEEINRQLVELRAQMKDIKRQHKSGRYLPANEAETRRVEAYEKLEATRKRDFPSFYFRDISLSWSHGSGYALFYGGKLEYSLETEGKTGWELEQAEIAQAVVKLLTRYETPAK